MAQLRQQQERAVHPLVRALHLGEPGELPVGLVARVFEQRVARALDPAAVLAARAAVAVVLVTTDLVGRATAELDHVKRVKRDSRVRDRLVDRFLVAGRHVDRHRLDRGALLVAERVEEGLQCGGVAARRRPHHAAA